MSEPRFFFPVALNFNDWACVIVGGGDEAEFKTRIFNEFEKAPTVIAEDFTTGLKEIAEAGNAILVREPYSPDLLNGAKVVLACSEDEQLNLTVGNDAHARGILFNMVDNAEVSDFIASSFVRRGNITVNVMTDALSPAFANSVRDKVAGIIENDYQDYLEFFVDTKVRINDLTDDLQVKKKVWRELVALGLLEIIETEGKVVAASNVDRVLRRHFNIPKKGAGPEPSTGHVNDGTKNGD